MGLIIVKVGGGAALNVDGVVQDLATMSEPAVVVLGANAVRDALAQKRRAALGETLGGIAARLR